MAQFTRTNGIRILANFRFGIRSNTAANTAAIVQSHMNSHGARARASSARASKNLPWIIMNRIYRKGIRETLNAFIRILKKKCLLSLMNTYQYWCTWRDIDKNEFRVTKTLPVFVFQFFFVSFETRIKKLYIWNYNIQQVVWSGQLWRIQSGYITSNNYSTHSYTVIAWKQILNARFKMPAPKLRTNHM